MCSNYIILGIMSTLVTYILLYVYRRWFGKLLLDRPSGLKKHDGNIPLIGGCGILSGMLLSLFLFLPLLPISFVFHKHFCFFFVGGVIVFLTGLIDDIKKPKGLLISTRLILQSFSAICLFYSGCNINIFESFYWNLIFSCLWVVGLINAFNLMDILDGLCSSQAIIISLGLFFISFQTGIWYVSCISIALVGACLGFIPYNFSKTKKCFLGDSGSNFVGFLIASLCLISGQIVFSYKNIIAHLFLVLVPIVDITSVVVTRIFYGKNPFKGSRDHIALKLKDKGWSLNAILFVFIASCIVCNVLASLIIFIG